MKFSIFFEAALTPEQAKIQSDIKRTRFFKLFADLWVKSDKLTNTDILLSEEVKKHVADAIGVDINGHVILDTRYILDAYKPVRGGIASWLKYRQSPAEIFIAALFSTIVGNKKYEKQAPTYSTASNLKMTTQHHQPILVDITPEEKKETINRIRYKITPLIRYIGTIVQRLKEIDIWRQVPLTGQLPAPPPVEVAETPAPAAAPELKPTENVPPVEEK